MSAYQPAQADWPKVASSLSPKRAIVFSTAASFGSPAGPTSSSRSAVSARRVHDGLLAEVHVAAQPVVLLARLGRRRRPGCWAASAADPSSRRDGSSRQVGRSVLVASTVHLGQVHETPSGVRGVGGLHESAARDPGTPIRACVSSAPSSSSVPDHGAVGEGDLDRGWQAAAGGRGEEFRTAIQQRRRTAWSAFALANWPGLDVDESVCAIAGHT